MQNIPRQHYEYVSMLIYVSTSMNQIRRSHQGCVETSLRTRNPFSAFLDMLTGVAQTTPTS